LSNDFRDKNRENTDYDQSQGNYDYDDEMSRKAVGKLLTDLDDDDNGFAMPTKPVVRAIRINSEKIKQEKISTNVYDENRSKRHNSHDDAIVTGFKEEEEDEEIVPEIVEPLPVEEDLGDKVRTRRPNILKEESGEDREEREKSRKQFLGGYTDHRRKGLDFNFTDSNSVSEPRRRSSSSSDNEPVKRFSMERDTEKDFDKKEPENISRRRVREETADTKPSPRSRRQRDLDEDVTIIPKRPDRKERQPMYAAASSAQPISYDAPIFKIIVAVFVVMLVLMVILVININGANSRVRELEGYIDQFEEVEADRDSYRAQVMSYQTQISNLREERLGLQHQLENLEVLLSATDAPEPPPYTPQGTDPLPGGMREHRVRHGDTLSRIAEQFQLGPGGIEAIRQANNLAPDAVIHPDQVLIIPGP